MIVESKDLEALRETTSKALIALLSRLPDRPGRERLQAWTALVRAGYLQALAAALIEAHYDPAYRRSGHKAQGAVIGAAATAGWLDRTAR